MAFWPLLLLLLDQNMKKNMTWANMQKNMKFSEFC